MKYSRRTDSRRTDKLVSCTSSTRLHILHKAGILAIVTEMLDDIALTNAIDAVPCLARSISRRVVRRTMVQLFGSMWQRYYDVCVRHSTVATAPTNQKAKVIPTHYDRSSLWGLGYELQLPEHSADLHAFLVKTTSETLNAMTSHCNDHDYSFVPGEPSQCGIEWIEFCENGRLLWIAYHSWEKRYCSREILDFLNRTGSYYDSRKESPLKLDGQVVIDDTVAKRTKIRLARNQIRIPKPVPDFGHELWDVGATPVPRCLWSTFWETGKGESQDGDALPSSLARPVAVFARNEYDGFLLPTMRPFYCHDPFYPHYRRSPFLAFLGTRLSSSVRFIEFYQSFAVVDLLHLKRLDFMGYANLVAPRLSPDSTYLGAISSNAHGESTDNTAQHTLAVWRVALPRPVLVWPAGLPGLCTKCNWMIDSYWLVTHCAESHGTNLYYLESKSPKAVVVTHLVGRHDPASMPLFRICGANGNVLICDSMSSRSFCLILLSQTGCGDWLATPLRLSTRPTSINLTKEEAKLAGLETTRYIQRAGLRYFITITGELFDIGLSHARQETCTTTRVNANAKTLRPYFIRQNAQVLALYERAESDNAIAVVCDKHDPKALLGFWQFASTSKRELLCSRGYGVSKDDVKLVTFSPDGMNLFITPRKDERTGWVVTFTAKAFGVVPSGIDYSVIEVPNCAPVVTPSERDSNWTYLLYPEFLAEGVVVLHERCGAKLYHGLFEQLDHRYMCTNLIWVHDRYVVVDDIPLGSVIEQPCPSTGGNKTKALQNRLRSSYRRWIDVLQEERWNGQRRRSIFRAGPYTSLSPGKRILAYHANRIPEVNAPPHIELRDLAKPCNTPSTLGLRDSWKSFKYCLRLRKDYRRPIMQELDTRVRMSDGSIR